MTDFFLAFWSVFWKVALIYAVWEVAKYLFNKVREWENT